MMPLGFPLKGLQGGAGLQPETPADQLLGICKQSSMRKASTGTEQKEVRWFGVLKGHHVDNAY
eukprot:302043-Pelagomonas_calceolata.AAC.1